MNIILYIGLHKTGTTFLQKNFLKNLNHEDIEYNPPEIMSLLELIFVNRKNIKNKILKVKKIIELKKKKQKLKKIFISNERISQLFFTNNYEKNLTIIKDIFPKAKIIIFLRYQPDWLLSCYKQSIHSGDCQSIENFLNYKNNKFKKAKGIYNSNGFLHTNIYKVDYTTLIKKYAKQYEKKNVYIFFFENFKKSKKKIFFEICKILKASSVNFFFDYKINRSFSSLACILSIYRYNFLKIFNLHKYLSNTKKLRNNLILQSSSCHIPWNYAKRHKSFLELIPFFLFMVFIKFCKFFTWRNFIQNCFDKIIYINKDLLENEIRIKLNLIYRKKKSFLNIYKKKFPVYI